MVKGMVLDAERYDPLSVARGDDATRLVTLRNLGWEPVVRRLKLDASIGFTSDGPVEVRQFHPCERILGTFKPGEEVAITVFPFRSCLLLVDAKQTGAVGLRGCDYEVGRNIRIECNPAQPFRYLRTDLVPDKLVEIRGFSEGKELDRSGWRASRRSARHGPCPSLSMRPRLGVVSPSLATASTAAKAPGLRSGWTVAGSALRSAPHPIP
jgi:hypothetical protein